MHFYRLKKFRQIKRDKKLRDGIRAEICNMLIFKSNIIERDTFNYYCI